MNRSSFDRPRSGTGNATVWVLSGLVIVLLGVIVFLWMRDSSPAKAGTEADDMNKETPDVPPNAKIPRDALPEGSKTAPPQAVGKPERIKEALQVGKTYRSVQKMCLEARGEDRDWGAKEIIKVGLVAECISSRTIESNDGHKVVEMRHIECHRAVKLLTGAGEFSLEPGPPDEPLLGALDKIRKGAWVRIEPVKPITEKIAPGNAALGDDKTTKLFAIVNRLSGKKVRLTSIDGKGIVGIEPIECTLNAWERDFFFSKDAMVLTRFLIDPEIKPGSTWTLDGELFSELLDLIDPDPHPRISGQVVVIREADSSENDKRYANLTVKAAESALRLRETAEKAEFFGLFRPSGRMVYSLSDHHFTTIRLDGSLRIEAVPRNSPLKKATFVEEPKLKVSYACRLQ